MSKRKIPITALALAIIMITSAISSCGKPPSSTEEPTANITEATSMTSTTSGTSTEAPNEQTSDNSATSNATEPPVEEETEAVEANA